MPDNEARWIEPGGGVEQWRKLNKYRDGRPVSWICNYVDLLSNDDYLDLTGDQRSILHGLWLAFASSRAHLHADTRSLSRRLSLRVTTPQLERLEQAGWIRLSVTKPSRKRYGFVTSRDAREGEGRSGEGLDQNQIHSLRDVDLELNGGPPPHVDADVPFELLNPTPNIEETV